MWKCLKLENIIFIALDLAKVCRKLIHLDAVRCKGISIDCFSVPCIVFCFALHFFNLMCYDGVEGCARNTQ